MVPKWSVYILYQKVIFNTSSPVEMRSKLLQDLKIFKSYGILKKLLKIWISHKMFEKVSEILQTS